MNRLLLLLIIALGYSCTSPSDTSEISSYDLILLNARIIDVENNSASEPRLVGIINDTVRIVLDMTEATGLEATRKLDLEGQYIMPGLWDNHVHFRGGDSLIAENRKLLPLFTAHGVTTVRDAGGDMTPAVWKWRKEIAQGLLLGPTIFSSGPKLDGDSPAWAGSIKVVNETDVSKALDSLEELGADYVKMYDGNLTPEMYYEIIRQAEERGLMTTGHMPMNADLMKAVDLGLDGTEHLYYILNAASPVGDSLRAEELGYAMMTSLVESYDEELAKQTYRRLAENPFFATPTLYIGQVLNTLPTTDHTNDTLLKYMGPGIQKTYERRLRSAMRRSPEAQERNTRMRETFTQMVKPMQEAGILIMAGSDCGPSNSFVYPGASLIGELELLVEQGQLSPAEALQASVINGPLFFGLEDYYGSIAQGKVADIIVLQKNPLEAIQNIRSLTLVIDQGNIIAAQRLLK